MHPYMGQSWQKNRTYRFLAVLASIEGMCSSAFFVSKNESISCDTQHRHLSSTQYLHQYLGMKDALRVAGSRQTGSRRPACGMCRGTHKRCVQLKNTHTHSSPDVGG
jgi:hypothetical protein